MTNRSKILATLLAFCAGGALAAYDPASASPEPQVARIAPADSQSLKIVAAAKAFEASLSETQKKALNYPFTDGAQRARWSNFPQSVFQRTGVAWGDLNAAQRTALKDLLATVLSPEGMKMVKEQMDADDELKNNPGAGGGPGGGGGGRGRGGPPGGGPPGGFAGGPPGGGRPGGGPPGGGRGPGGGGGGANFGSDMYFVAFLGTPSATAPWMLQFGGHHLAINATMVGANLTITPSLTGGQPTKYTKDGKPIYIVEKEVAQAQAMVNGLTAAQRAKAVISTRGIDLVLGPGHDGQVLQPEGLPGSEMTQAEKDQFVKLIEARIGILNADDLAVVMADVRRNLNQTYLAWYGPTDDAGSAYFRVTGPTIILEFSPQSMGGDASNHLHNMYRNPVNDYGAAWTSLK